jgi:uncharacterized iron-regulated membrane protein
MKYSVHSGWMAVHRYSGLAILVFLGFAALTGSALCFMRPLDAAINADLFRQQAASGPPPVAEVVDRFRAGHPGWMVRSFPLAIAADERIPVKVIPATGPDGVIVDQLFLDRASGALVGSRSAEPAFNRRGAIELLHDAHFTLMIQPYGRWFMGIVALAWLISNLIGVYLTFPVRGAFWKQWKRAWRFSFKSNFARLMLDLHRSFGLWLILPLTLLALTSVGLNFFREGYGPIVDRLVPEAAQTLPLSRPLGPLPLGAASAVAQARAIAATLPGTWLPASVVANPAKGTIGVTFTDDGTLSFRDFGLIYIYFDAATGRVTEVLDPYHGNTNLAAYRILYPVHSGRVAGWPTVALVFVCGLVTFGFCVTGAYLWWQRRPMREGGLRTVRGSRREI